MLLEADQSDPGPAVHRPPRLPHVERRRSTSALVAVVAFLLGMLFAASVSSPEHVRHVRVPGGSISVTTTTSSDGS